MKLQLQGARAPKTTHIQQINLNGYKFYSNFHFQSVVFFFSSCEGSAYWELCDKYRCGEQKAWKSFLSKSLKNIKEIRIIRKYHVL